MPRAGPGSGRGPGTIRRAPGRKSPSGAIAATAITGSGSFGVMGDESTRSCARATPQRKPLRCAAPGGRTMAERRLIRLGSGVAIDPVEYAISGNAVLGIRDSGKTYTATRMAEQLMNAKIPFIAFDPIGASRWLRVAGKGPGYPVVVAGGKTPDLPLPPQGAPGIGRASTRQ